MTSNLKCWKCGDFNLMQTPTYIKPLIRPNGDKLVFTVCASCFEINEFVNGNPVRVAVIPITKGMNTQRTN